jgi:hypothetical protein
MKRIGIETSRSHLDSVDAILASEETIVPSSGFLAAVMERVQEESCAPAPIPFPWKRAIPGFVLAAAVFGWAGVELVRRGVASAVNIPLTIPHGSVAFALPFDRAGWVVLALGISLASWLLARKIAGRPDAL